MRFKPRHVNKAPAARPTPAGRDRGALQGENRHPAVIRNATGSNADTHLAENLTLQPQWQLGAGMGRGTLCKVLLL